MNETEHPEVLRKLAREIVIMQSMSELEISAILRLVDEIETEFPPVNVRVTEDDIPVLTDHIFMVNTASLYRSYMLGKNHAIMEAASQQDYGV